MRKLILILSLVSLLGGCAAVPVEPDGIHPLSAPTLGAGDKFITSPSNTPKR